jgi:hypothetical protein
VRQAPYRRFHAHGIIFLGVWESSAGVELSLATAMTDR